MGDCGEVEIDNDVDTAAINKHAVCIISRHHNNCSLGRYYEH